MPLHTDICDISHTFIHHFDNTSYTFIPCFDIVWYTCILSFDIPYTERCFDIILHVFMQCWYFIIYGNVLFNNALNTFYLGLYGIKHMVKDHSDIERGNPLLPHGLLFLINSKGSFICIILQTGWHIPQSWITGWNGNKLNGSTMKERSDNPLHHERTLLPRSYILLPSSYTFISIEISNFMVLWIIE